MDKSSIKFDWTKYDRRPTWSVISSRELSDVLGVSLQSINNWKMRGFLPEPLSSKHCPPGNKNYWRISAVKVWLEGGSEEEIHWAWVKKWIPEFSPSSSSLAQVNQFLKREYKIFDVEKPLELFSKLNH